MPKYPQFFQCPWDAPDHMADKWGWMDEDGECFHGEYYDTEEQARAAYAKAQEQV